MLVMLISVAVGYSPPPTTGRLVHSIAPRMINKLNIQNVSLFLLFSDNSKTIRKTEGVESLRF